MTESTQVTVDDVENSLLSGIKAAGDAAARTAQDKKGEIALAYAQTALALSEAYDKVRSAV